VELVEQLAKEMGHELVLKLEAVLEHVMEMVKEHESAAWLVEVLEEMWAEVSDKGLEQELEYLLASD